MTRETKRGFQSVGSILPKVTDPVFRKHSHILIHLIHHWIQIVGVDYGRYSAPVRLNFNKGETTDGILSVMVDSRYALEFQHLSHVIIEKINQSMGFKALARLVIHQTSWVRDPATQSKKRQLSQGFKATPALRTAIDSITDADVKAALNDFLITIHESDAM